MSFMKLIKTLSLFIIFLLLYFLPIFLFKADTSFYNTISKPQYASPSWLFKMIWPILYAIFSFYLAYHLIYKALAKELILYFLLNYIISFFFIKVFFIDKDFFLSFAVAFCSFISGLFILITTFKDSKRDFLYFLPYVLWTLYASILMANIYLIQ